MVGVATIREMVRGKEITSVKDMIRAIELGDRELRTKECSPESLPNRFDEMYEMITLLELDEATAGGTVIDADVLSARALDPYCRQMWVSRVKCLVQRAVENSR